jgi:hypothetical protein
MINVHFTRLLLILTGENVLDLYHPMINGHINYREDYSDDHLKTDQSIESEQGPSGKDEAAGDGEIQNTQVFSELFV